MYVRKINPLLAERRNHKILEARLSGRTLKDIGDEYDMTRERVRQIVNFTMERLSKEDRARADGLMAVNLQGGIERHMELNRKLVIHELRTLFKTEFNREKILEITNSTFAGTDLELCSWLYGKYQIKNFFTWRRCWCCKEIKSMTPTFHKTGVCTQCNTIRHRKMMASNHKHLQKARERQRDNPNYARRCSLRSIYRKRGEYDKMPPLPPKGTPDDQIVLPPKQTLLGWDRYKWREKKKLKRS